MIPKRGDLIRTAFLTGTVLEVMDGRRRGWNPTLYFEVIVATPQKAAGTKQIVRLDELRATADV